MSKKLAGLPAFDTIQSAAALTIAKDSNRPAKAKPFLKWAGGKKQLLPALLARLPKSFHRYYEPMLGGGALFFYIAPKNAYLSDTNAELINAYLVVKGALDPLIIDLNQHIHTEQYYYQMRKADRLPEYANWSDVQKASRLIFLNKTCYNGLFRVNSKGYFNTPFGRYANPRIADEANLRLCHHALKKAKICAASFEKISASVKADDFVYFDPPYLPLNQSSSFTSYCAGGFDFGMQQELRDFCAYLHRKGVKFMLSNSHTPETLELYSDFNIETVQAKRAINSKAEKRGSVTEIIVTNY